MIRNDEQLAVVKRQLQRVEAALHSIERDVLPQNPVRFQIMAEAYVDQIDELRRQIDEYLGVTMVTHASSEQAGGEEHAEVVGTVRQVDLDAKLFVLRGRDGAADLPCEYDERMEPAVKASLDKRVSVGGVLRTSGRTRRQMMEVQTIERLSPG